MENGKLWIFNYDLEFQLAGRGAISVAKSQLLPWYFLNRNAIILAPLLKREDSIAVYEKPDEALLDHYKNRSIPIPRLIEIQKKDQTNSAIDDFEVFLSRQKKEGLRCSFWGLSEKALKLKSKPVGYEIIKILNSKIYTNRLRNNYLPTSWQIPGIELKGKDVTSEVLKSSIKDHLSEHGNCLIKHAFGASGRLIEELTDDNISKGKLKRWLHWIKKEGGALIEKKIKIQQEWSLQLQFLKDQQVQPIALTRLFNSSDLSYGGTVVHEPDQRRLSKLVIELKPIIDQIISLGYLGPLGIDLIESLSGNFHLLEINARYTMGRVAYEWYKRSGSGTGSGTGRSGHFLNFFYRSSAEMGLKEVLNTYNSIAPVPKAKWLIVNNTIHREINKSFITLYVESDSIEHCVEASNKLKNILLNQYIN